jgi:hypothetical protein
MSWEHRGENMTGNLPYREEYQQQVVPPAKAWRLFIPAWEAVTASLEIESTLAYEAKDKVTAKAVTAKAVMAKWKVAEGARNQIYNCLWEENPSESGWVHSYMSDPCLWGYANNRWQNKTW